MLPLISPHVLRAAPMRLAIYRTTDHLASSSPVSDPAHSLLAFVVTSLEEVLQEACAFGGPGMLLRRMVVVDAPADAQPGGGGGAAQQKVVAPAFMSVRVREATPLVHDQVCTGHDTINAPGDDWRKEVPWSLPNETEGAAPAPGPPGGDSGSATALRQPGVFGVAPAATPAAASAAALAPLPLSRALAPAGPHAVARAYVIPLQRVAGRGQGVSSPGELEASSGREVLLQHIRSTRSGGAVLATEQVWETPLSLEVRARMRSRLRGRGCDGWVRVQVPAALLALWIEEHRQAAQCMEVEPALQLLRSRHEVRARSPAPACTQLRAHGVNRDTCAPRRRRWLSSTAWRWRASAPCPIVRVSVRLRDSKHSRRRPRCACAQRRPRRRGRRRMPQCAAAWRILGLACAETMARRTWRVTSLGSTPTRPRR